MIYIVGLGPGHKDYILPKALDILDKSHIVLGFKRALDSLNIEENKKVYLKKLLDIDKFLCNNDQSYNCKDKKLNTNISIVASGDPTFYGITNYIKTKASLDFEIIPGLSSFQYLTSKAKIPWNNAYLGSLHGRNEDFIECVNKKPLSIWLTDNENTPRELCRKLYNENIKCEVVIGENLSYEDEVITIGIPIDLMKNDYSKLSIFIVRRI